MSPTADTLAALSFTPIDPLFPNTLLYTPQTPPPQPKSPLKVIILATWLGGASASRIAVYCRGYQAAYPSASILLIRTVLSDITVKSFATVQAQLHPARDFLLQAFSLDGSNRNHSKDHGSALLHMFSHGGCNTALQLSRLLRTSTSTLNLNPNLNPNTALPLPLAGIILDSCPGSSGFTKAYSGALHSLAPFPQNPLTNLLGRLSLLPIIGSVSLLQSSGLLSSVEDLRRELNDPDTFGPVPRLYLHSKGDRLVAAGDVAAHAAELETLFGGKVRVEREVWEVAEHVALPLEDAERYWRVVGEFVDGTVTRQARQTKL